MSSQPKSFLWIKHISAKSYVIVTPPARLYVSNVSLGYQLPDVSDRGSLLFGSLGSRGPTCVASFKKGVREQVHLDLVLEANVRYAFIVNGPFPVDLIGNYQPGDPKLTPIAARTNTISAPSVSATRKDLGNKVHEQKKRKVHEESSDTRDSVKAKTYKLTTSSPTAAQGSTKRQSTSRHQPSKVAVVQQRHVDSNVNPLPQPSKSQSTSRHHVSKPTTAQQHLPPVGTNTRQLPQTPAPQPEAKSSKPWSMFSFISSA